jgi:hypothetical protein
MADEISGQVLDQLALFIDEIHAACKEEAEPSPSS